MPLDTCITNVGEYYSSHYLDSTFTRDVKDLVTKWNDLGPQAPPRRLQNLSQYYFRAKTQVLDEEEPLRRQFAGDEARGWHAHLLHALGYAELERLDHPTEGGDTFVPTLGRVNRYNKPWLVVCETHFCLPDGSLKEGMPSEDPLGMQPYKDQLKDQATHELCEGDWSRCVGRIFTEEDAPRWILFVAGSQVLLLDRNTFAQGRFLAFDLDDAFGRKEKDTFNHIAAFLSVDTLCPGGESDEVLLDRLEEQSHRFAHGVTESLQIAVREAIGLLANEWVEDRRAKGWGYSRLRAEEADIGLAHDFSQNEDGSYEVTADQLRRESLTFVYRLLFCLYAEARVGELEILPMEWDVYRLGYSFESLRDLELVPLTDKTGAGTYFHEHLKTLFGLIHNGFQPNGKEREQARFEFQTETVKTFTVRPLTATLFSPDTTPLLNRANLSNRCLQQVIRKLSLSTDERSRTIGRVNYAELGINQLGAVYEGLLSYKGMFADQDLIHVKPDGKSFQDKKTPTWFVSKDRLDDFTLKATVDGQEVTLDTIERLPDGKPRIYTKGTFILHLNGIDREQSASYYTPEVLTKCLVEEALRELLKDFTPDRADEILELKICEPAMGSGAFLNEAAEQLATRYLELKQKQLQEMYPDGECPLAELRIERGMGRIGESAIASLSEPGARALPLTDSSTATMVVAEKQLAWRAGSVPTSIEPARYSDELRRVKHYIATRNIYGVDLNATAVELGQLSLWLGSIHRLLVHKSETGGRDIYQSGATPWFGLRLRCGDSLIGARRAVWTVEQLRRGEHAWSSALIQQVQSDVRVLSEHSTPAALREVKKETLDLMAKIKWDEMLPDAALCRAQVERFCNCALERHTDGLARDEKELYEKRQSTWKRVTSQKDRDALLALYDLLPNGRARQVQRDSYDIFRSLDSQHSGYEAGLPRLLRPGESRRATEVYHFLVFDPDMVPTRSDKLMKSFRKDDCDTAAAWVKDHAKPKWKSEETKEALAICELVDEHWAEYAKQRAAALEKTACTATVWPVPSNCPEAIAAGPSLDEQERICSELESTSGSFQRLRLVMDTWCAIWFWPLDEVSKLPTRDGFLASAHLLLGAEPPNREWRGILSTKLGFAIEVLLQASDDQVPDTDRLAAGVPWCGVADEIRDEQHFHHWGLVFPEVLGLAAARGGFDLVLGNPPWIKPTWADAAALSELDPALGVQEGKSAEFNSRRPALLAPTEAREYYFAEMTRADGAISFLNGHRSYQLLAGIQTNLYKNFIVTSFQIGRASGVAGFLHPEGVFNDSKGELLRSVIYPRLRAYFQFENEYNLFSGTNDHGRMRFCVCIYGGRSESVTFTMMCNIFLPQTILASRTDERSNAPVPGIKSPNGKWETRGHANRIVKISADELEAFAELFGDGTSSLETRLPQVHSVEIARVLKRVTRWEKRLSSLSGRYFSSEMFHEADAQRKGQIARVESPSYVPQTTDDWIICNPHFHVATPFNRTARTVCKNSNHYDDVELTSLPEHYTPRSVFRPVDESNSDSPYASAIPRWPSTDSPVTQRYRHINRRRISTATERTFISAIAPKGATHINPAISLTFADDVDLVLFAGTTCSLPIDFIMKVSGRSDVYSSTLDGLPFVCETQFDAAIARRVLRLNCLTADYADLWESAVDEEIMTDSWTSDDARLRNPFELDWAILDPASWTSKSAIRTEFGRRQALLEIDVLVSLAIGLRLDELQTIYEVQFPVLQHHDATDLFDVQGIMIPNPERRGWRGQGARECVVALEEWNARGNSMDDSRSEPLMVSWAIDDGKDRVSRTFYPPFTRVDRKTDYASAWAAFEKRYAG